MSGTLDPTIRVANVAILFKLEGVEGVDANPTGAANAIPVEYDSITHNTPWTTEGSNEATGSLVAGAPNVIGQAFTISFRSRIKGAGAGAVYSALVKPPLHDPLQACGWRGQFTAAVAAAAATAGGATSVTLPAAFSGVSRAVLGMMLAITGGAGAGAYPAVIEYTAGRVATLADTFNPPLDNTSMVALPANWTYAQTSPIDGASRAIDMPAGTLYFFKDGTLIKAFACRGTFTPDGTNAKAGFGTFNFTGIYGSKTDAAIPTDLAVAGHSAPVLVQGGSKSLAVSVDRKPLAISTWSMDPGSQIEDVENPNTQYGFDAGQIVDRVPVIKLDPYATLVANRDTITDIGNAANYPVVIRHGSVAGNRWALVVPKAQPTEATPGTRGKLASEDLSLQCLGIGKDAFTRDTDRILCFY